MAFRVIEIIIIEFIIDLIVTFCRLFGYYQLGTVLFDKCFSDDWLRFDFIAKIIIKVIILIQYVLTLLLVYCFDCFFCL